MREQQQIEKAYQELAEIINDCPRFERVLPGREARQFALGIAAGLDFAMGKEVRPLYELLARIREMRPKAQWSSRKPD